MGAVGTGSQGKHRVYRRSSGAEGQVVHGVQASRGVEG